MKRVLSLFVVIAATAMLSGAAQAWETVAPEGAGFSIEMPSEPSSSVQELDSAAGAVEFTMMMSPMEENSQTMYMMGYGDLPAAEDFDSQAELDAVVANFTGGDEIDATVSDIEIEDGIGKEISVDILEGIFLGKMRIYLVGQRVYLMGVGGPSADQPEEESVSHFFDSFAQETTGAAP